MLTLGTSLDGGSSVDLSIKERKQGTYIIGTTGTGKSTLIRNMIYQDMKPGRHEGLCLLDPHGDLIDSILGLVPNERADDVILFDPMDTERPVGLNLLACHRDNANEVRWVVSTVISILQRLFNYSWGPRLQHVLSNALETIMLFENTTFLELYYLISNKKYRKHIISKLKDPVLIEFWNSFPEANARLEYELTASTLNKIAPFITDKMMRNIICQTENTINLEKIMNEGKILLVNLSKGDLGEVNSSLLGAILVNLVLIAAFSRRQIDVEKRAPFHLYVDEFQNFATESFAILQSEARKYEVDVIVAHQFRDQLDDLNKGSTLNVGNLIIFRNTGRDGKELASIFDNTPPPPDLLWETVRTPSNMWPGVYERGSVDKPVPGPRRLYSDVEAEMANKLAVLPNYRAWCRLIYDPKSRGIEDKDPEIRQYLVKTSVMDNNRSDIKKSEMANRIRKNSRKDLKPQKLVEKEIYERSVGLYGDDTGILTEELKEN